MCISIGLNHAKLYELPIFRVIIAYLVGLNLQSVKLKTDNTMNCLRLACLVFMITTLCKLLYIMFSLVSHKSDFIV